MSSSLASRWTFYDKIIQYIRFNRAAREVPDGCILVDCGCGTGEFLKFIRNRIKNGYGIDSVLKGSEIEKIHFLEGDLDKKIPLPSDHVDCVTALAIIEHLNQAEIFAGEVFRILKKGGTCILTTPAPMSKPILEFMAFKLKIISENDIGDHKRYFSAKDLNILFSRFSEVRIKKFFFNMNTIVILKK